MGKYSAILDKVQARLAAQVATGKLLEGIKLHQAPISRVEGVADLPSVAVQGIELVEDYGTQPKVRPTVRVAVVVATRRDAGAEAFAQLVEKVMDSVELNGTTFDGTLDGLVTDWVTIELLDTGIGDMSISGTVVVEAMPVTFNRGARRS